MQRLPDAHTQIPFTSNHQAGIQAFNTQNFGQTQGPLFFLNPP
jgi:hypothetical protein